MTTHKGTLSLFLALVLLRLGSTDIGYYHYVTEEPSRGPCTCDGPKGEKGESGFPGHRGPRGHKGEQGKQGLTGPGGKGRQGEKGVPGSSGPQGLQGPVGVPGDSGRPGLNGKDGRPGLNGEDGRSGPQGPQGFAGKQGRVGLAGPKGEKGESGLQGSQGLLGPRGLPGEDGSHGWPGHRGGRGPRGFKGDVGEPGLPGRMGSRGAPGPEMSEDLLKRYFSPAKQLITDVNVMNETLSQTVSELGRVLSAMKEEVCWYRQSNMYVGAAVWQDKLFNSGYNVSLSVLIDGETTTGGWGSAGSTAGHHWLQETFARPVSADTVYVGGGAVPSWGAATGYGPFDLKAFNETVRSWVSVATLPKIAGTSIYKYTFETQTSRYWRLYTTSGTRAATTEFRLEDASPCF